MNSAQDIFGIWRLINISTTYANTGSGFVLPSAVAKAGCDNMTKSLGAEWGKYGIRINSIAPGPIYTEGAFSRLDPGGQFRKKAEERLPMGRLGETEELAHLVCFITSEHMNWMTGQIINPSIPLNNKPLLKSKI